VALTEAYFVARTVRALERLAFGPVSVPELADYLQVHPRTARRLMLRLRDEDYVTRPPGARRYHLTPRLLAVAAQAQRSSDPDASAGVAAAAPDTATIAAALGLAVERVESLRVPRGQDGQLAPLEVLETP
jgi:DNA-binding IclR family transcriptional regulator